MNGTLRVSEQSNSRLVGTWNISIENQYRSKFVVACEPRAEFSASDYCIA